MKVRLGFVSNSSASSFLLIGIVIDRDDFIKLVKNKILDSQKLVDNCNKYYNGDWDKYLQEEDVDYVVDKMVKDTHPDSKLMVRQIGDNDDTLYIGVDPETTMKDDETLLDLKKRVQEYLKTAGINMDIKSMDWHSGCWMDT